jgi:hypothetical protein
MASSSTGNWGEGPVEYGRPPGGKPGSHCIWSLWNAGTVAHAEVREHPLGHQLCVYLDGSLLFTSVHMTREAAEHEAHGLKEKALAEAWTDPWTHRAAG